MEMWKDIPDYEGLYEVSDQGRVRSKEGKLTYTKHHGFREWKPRILKEKNRTARESRVDLWKNGRPKTYLVYQLVGKAFIPNPSGYNCINHLDGNPRNNNLENLEWCDHYINNNHAFDNRLIKTGKLTTLISLSSGETYEFRSIAKAAEFLGRSSNFITNNQSGDGYRFIIQDYDA